MSIPVTVETGSGSWTPWVWIGVVAVAWALTLLLRACGEKSYKKGTDQEKPFFSGNELEVRDALHIRGDNLYWGFVESLKSYYRKIVPLHTGVATDYVLWYLGVLALMLMIGLAL